ncbi:MAG: HU family DNA-binding protein [Bacteroidales bacterium]|nr:HU family DNA-binding protein [Bacteroidales bacterium]
MLYEIIRNPGFKDDEKNFFVAPVCEGVFNTEDLIRSVAHGSTLSSADMKAALTAIVETLAEALATGKRVKLDGLGSFSLKLTTDADINDTDEKIGKKISIKTVKFLPAKELLQKMGKVTFQRTQNPRTVQWDELPQDQEERLVAFLRQNTFLRRADAEHIWCCKRTTASRLLNSFCEKGIIRNAGTPRMPIYVLASNEAGQEA